MSFFPRDVLDEILKKLSQFLRVFLPTHDHVSEKGPYSFNMEGQDLVRDTVLCSQYEGKMLSVKKTIITSEGYDIVSDVGYSHVCDTCSRVLI